MDLAHENLQTQLQRPSALNRCLAIHDTYFQCLVLPFSSLILFSAALNPLQYLTPWLL